jgi:glutathione synthase/RimK-type ligase-like ATP-grasp enzyme
VILVVSYPDEDHTAAVVDRLRGRGHAVHVLDLAELPSRCGVTLRWEDGGAPVFRLEPDSGTLDLNAVAVIWWRRLRPFGLDPEVASSARGFALSETSQAVNGLLDSLDCAWVNDRSADEAAHRKPLQWTTARAVGLAVPRTLVTTNPGDARMFVESVGLGRTVFKAFLASLEAWRETRLVEAADLERLDLVRLAPVIFQEYVEGVDLRITIIGEAVFAAAIDARGTSYPVDMRMALGEAQVAAIELPGDVRERLLALMRALGLTYGAVDMRRTDDGQYLFLEVNPAGQWLFVERLTGLPISQAVTDELARLDHSRARAWSVPR